MPSSPLALALATHCRDRPQEEAIHSRGEGVRLTFGELAHEIEAAGSQILAPRGETVALALGNRVSFLTHFFALHRAGHPIAPLDASLSRDQQLRLCGRLGIRNLLTTKGKGQGESEASGCGIDPGPPPKVDQETQLGPGILNLSIAVEPTPAPKTTAVIKLTSGSTGQPVGVCLSAQALFEGIRQIGTGMQIGPTDRVLLAIPLSHSYGFDNGVLSLAVSGSPLVLENGFFPASLLRAIIEDRISVFPAVPPMVRALAESEWPEVPDLRRVISAGGPLPPEFAQRFLASSGHPVHQFDGSTETGGICFETAPTSPEAAGTVGQPLPGVLVELDENQQVQVTSKANFFAYLGQELVDQAQVIRQKILLGDRAEWTEEGRLRLTGRAADLLNIGGRKVAAATIEAALRGVEGIEDAAVVGIADPVRGDRVVAFVVGDCSKVRRSSLPKGLAPREVRPLSALPYTARGKLDRGALRSLAQSD